MTDAVNRMLVCVHVYLLVCLAEVDSIPASSLPSRPVRRLSGDDNAFLCPSPKSSSRSSLKASQPGGTPTAPPNSAAPSPRPRRRVPPPVQAGLKPSASAECLSDIGDRQPAVHCTPHEYEDYLTPSEAQLHLRLAPVPAVRRGVHPARGLSLTPEPFSSADIARRQAQDSLRGTLTDGELAGIVIEPYFWLLRLYMLKIATRKPSIRGLLLNYAEVMDKNHLYAAKSMEVVSRKHYEESNFAAYNCVIFVDSVPNTVWAVKINPFLGLVPGMVWPCLMCAG